LHYQNNFCEYEFYSTSALILIAVNQFTKRMADYKNDI